MRASTLDAISMETTQDRTIACPAFLHKKIGERPAWQAEIHSRKDVVPPKVDNRYAQTLLEEDQRQIETKKRVGETFCHQREKWNGDGDAGEIYGRSANGRTLSWIRDVYQPIVAQRTSRLEVGETC